MDDGAIPKNTFCSRPRQGAQIIHRDQRSMLPNSDYLLWGTSIWFFCGTERIHESSPIIKKEGGSRRIWVARPCTSLHCRIFDGNSMRLQRPGTRSTVPLRRARRNSQLVLVIFRPFAASWVDRVCSISAVAPAKLCFTSPIAFLVESVWISVQV